MNTLLDTSWSWGDYFRKNVPSYSDALVKAFDTITLVMWIILGVVGAIGAIYAVYLGIQLARAEDQGKRDEAKKHLITVLIAVGITLLLILFFNVLLPGILSAFASNNGAGEKTFINLFLNK